MSSLSREGARRRYVSDEGLNAPRGIALGQELGYMTSLKTLYALFALFFAPTWLLCLPACGCPSDHGRVGY